MESQYVLYEGDYIEDWTAYVLGNGFVLSQAFNVSLQQRTLNLIYRVIVLDIFDFITLRNLHLLTHYLDRVSQALIHQIEYLRVWKVFFGLKGIRPGAS